MPAGSNTNRSNVDSNRSSDSKDGGRGGSSSDSPNRTPPSQKGK